MRRIVLGLTGSVATVLWRKLIGDLQKLGDVDVILTERANHFIDHHTFHLFRKKMGFTVYDDTCEWLFPSKQESGFSVNVRGDLWGKGDPVLHINIRDKGSALVIAPCSANTMAKISGGICDNLLTTVVRAWDQKRPVVIAPAMNTQMWEHPVTEDTLEKLKHWGYRIVEPQKKLLACGTYGDGALAEIDEIVKMVKNELQWRLPIEVDKFTGIPVGSHPGAFSTQRKHEKHTGVDLYAEEKTIVRAVEAGKVVGVEHFTGEWDNTPWWNNTDCVLVEGPTGVVCYGEITPKEGLKVGYEVVAGNIIGNVKRVLKEGKDRPDIPGHRTSMLHIELYPHGTVKASNGFEPHLQDPTPFLLEAFDAHRVEKLTYAENNKITL